MKVKQHYDGFPEYTYNTAFGSLLTDLNYINQTAVIGGDESKENNEQYSQNMFEMTPCQIDDHLMSSTQICNNSAWNNKHNFQQQSIKDIIKILIDFLGEFLLFLSSIIVCKQFYSQLQLQKMVDIAERIHQLRLTLLIQINNTNESITNSSIINITSISLILHELASCIDCLSKEQQQIGTIIEHPQTTMFTQLLDRLKKAIQSCMDCVSMNSNPQNFQTSIPVMYPCLNSPYMIDNSTLSTGCWFRCKGSNMCIPWSLLEQIKNSGEKDHIFGLMYGIKDENIRGKLGYGIGKHKSPNRKNQAFRKISKQKYKRNDVLNEESNIDSNREWTASSNDDQMPMIPKASVASTKEKFKMTEQKEIKEKNERISANSIISEKKNSTNRLGSSRTISQQQSIVNSKQSSPLSRSNFDMNKPIKLSSIYDRLTVSDSNGRIINRAISSHTEELPTTSILDHSGSQRTSSRRLQQQQSNIVNEENDKIARSLSVQTYGYQTPSKTTIKMSRESSESLSPVHSKSINTPQSNGSIQSRKVPSINDVIGKKSTSTIARSDGKQSFKESINQNPSSYQTHTDNIDSTVTFASHDKIKHNDSLLNKSWEQRLSSPLSIISAPRMNSSELKQNIISPSSNKQLSINETTSDFNFDKYSEYHRSPSTSFLNETNDNISLLNVIEGPQSTEGEKNTINPSDNNKKDLSTPHFSSINTYRQRSASATSDSDDLPLFPKTKKHSSRSMTRKKRKCYSQEITSIPLQSNKQGYFNKFIHCFRRMPVNRIDESEYQNK